MLEVSFRRPQVKRSVLTNHYPTVVMFRDHEGCDQLNHKLEQLMLRLERETANLSAKTSNLGGYHTGTRLFSRSEPEIGMLRELVQQALTDYVPKFLEVMVNPDSPPADLKLKLWGWGINMRAGDINFQHVHPDAKVSGVYYVSVPPLPASSNTQEGAIMFADPRPRAHMNRIANQNTQITVIPKPGMMIVFPAYYEHAVIPFRGPGVRICIAFNADL